MDRIPARAGAPAIRAGAGVSTEEDAARAALEAAATVAEDLRGEPPDLACVFISPHHRLRDEAVLGAVLETLRPRHLVGCTGEWVLGRDRELEGEAAVAVWGALLPGAEVETFHAELVRGERHAGFAGLPDLARPPTPKAVLLLADPFSFPTEALLEWGSRQAPGVPFVGGIASGAPTPGYNRLFCDGSIHDVGAVGAVVRGPVRVRTIVSQGCRPIGRSFVVTKAEGHVIYELAGRPALERLEEVLRKEDPQDLELFRRGPHIGIVIDEYKETFERGDFLIRAILGANEREGWIAIGDTVEVGRTVQFHVRDPRSADEDLRLLLQRVPPVAAGALLFTCNGRGRRMFPEPHHDVRTIRAHVGAIPLAGFFCAGEIGPVGGRNFLHGFTASAAFFEPEDGS